MANILRWWLDRVEEYPSANCIAQNDLVLTNTEFFQLASTLGSVIEAHAIGGRNPVVGICGPRAPLTVACFIGALLTGRAYAVIDHKAPTARLSEMIATLDPSFFVIAGDVDIDRRAILVGELDARGTPWLDLPEFDISPFPPRAPSAWPLDADSRAVMYVLFTSGSTGAPKGVCVSHEACDAAISAYISDIDLTETDIVAGEVSITFDVSTFDIFGSLSTGALLCILDEETLSDSVRTFEHLNRINASVLFTVPTVIKEMDNAGAFDSKPLALRVLALTGEHLTADFRNRLPSAVAPDCAVWNMYGGTEMPFVFSEKVDVFADGDPSSFTLEGAAVEVGLDSNFSMGTACSGDTGELWVRGTPVLSGYLEPGGKWPVASDGARTHATGDLIEIRDGNRVAIIGRIDRQARIDGYRVELDMIEVWVEKFTGVLGCIAVPDSRHESVLAMIAVSEPENTSRLCENLTLYCKEGLPEFAIPRYFQAVVGLPKTESGKKDRVAARRALLLVVEGNAGDDLN